MDMELVHNQIYNTIVLVSLGTMAPTVLQVNKKGKNKLNKKIKRRIIGSYYRLLIINRLINSKTFDI